MKLKYKFEIREAGGQMFAAAIGDDAEKFPGMIGLNPAAMEIFTRLMQGTTEDEIVTAIAEKFDSPEDVIRERVREYIDQLDGVGAISR